MRSGLTFCGHLRRFPFGDNKVEMPGRQIHRFKSMDSQNIPHKHCSEKLVTTARPTSNYFYNQLVAVGKTFFGKHFFPHQSKNDKCAEQLAHKDCSSASQPNFSRSCSSRKRPETHGPCRVKRKTVKGRWVQLVVRFVLLSLSLLVCTLSCS